MLNIEDSIRARRSVRGFRPDPVSDELLQRIFALAQAAPSNCNTQPWAVHVVSGAKRDALRQRLMAAAPERGQHAPDFPFDGRYDGVFKQRQLDAALQLWKASGITREDRAARAVSTLRNYELFDAPHLALVYIPEGFGMREAADVGMYAQTLMLALAGFGLASCPQTSLSFFPHIFREELGVAPQLKLLFGISFGWEDTTVAANDCRIGRAGVGDAVVFHR